MHGKHITASSGRFGASFGPLKRVLQVEVLRLLKHALLHEVEELLI
jgi:hypothetical protein